MLTDVDRCFFTSDVFVYFRCVQVCWSSSGNKVDIHGLKDKWCLRKHSGQMLLILKQDS